MTPTTHHVHGVSHTLEVEKVTLTSECVFVISPELLVQEQEIFSLPWLTGAMCFISCKVPLSPLSCRDFGREWPQCLQCLHALFCLPKQVFCGSSGMLTLCHPENSNCISSYNFYTVIISIRMCPVFSNFTPKAFCHRSLIKCILNRSKLAVNYADRFGLGKT